MLDLDVIVAVLNKALKAACWAANAWDFIFSLPNDLNTSCGTSSSQLSEGQRQHIAIAQALIRKPSIVLLDKATSKLNIKLEKLIQGALLEAASSNNIMEVGMHSELVAKGGMYTKMCEAQRLDSAA
ncbi:P-loop containing nucleoside triphosphate hydrolase protein [Aspergillus parasiticus]|uniref:ABC multidrug transporter MDR2 n=1 Tax=Aspergillus parasiticus TaxID=5067 RepID=A0A5N6D136_ASPPA|nr:P-loop containing nucleoside triphosphate hydrolase protein [Aspergillus parasiticus]